VKLVISDAHGAIAAAVEKILPDASWQACRIHFGRNIARRVRPPKRQLAMAAFSAIFIQPDRERAVSAYHSFAEAMERLDPRLADYADDREVELTAFANFPPAHWRKIWSTNCWSG
jgi:putative transposase